MESENKYLTLLHNRTVHSIVISVCCSLARPKSLTSLSLAGLPLTVGSNSEAITLHPGDWKSLQEKAAFLSTGGFAFA